MAGWWRARVRIVAGVTVLALWLVPSAGAKFRITTALGDSTPAVAQATTVVLRAAVNVDHDLRLIAVAPGKKWWDVAGVVTSESSLAEASIPRDGFEVTLTRVAPNRWRGYVKFPRPGRWRLVVPNWAPVGMASPPPLLRSVVVR